jgi:dihydropyrimidinase
LAASSADVIDASGCYVLPGVIDAHVHPVHAETMATASEAAAYGGVTTLLHFIYVESDQGIVEALQAAREEGEATSILDFGLHARLTEVPRRLPELPAAVEMGVRSFKLFTAYRQRGIMSDDDDVFRAMEHIAALGGLTMTHAENGAVIDVLEARFREAGRKRPEDYPLTRPPGAEAEAVHRVAALARLAGSPLYVVHISCAEALAELMAARARGQEVYAETCPHYLTLTAEEAMPRFGSRAKIAPPLRAQSDVDELWRAVRDGRIDVVGSDHSAFDEAEKYSPDGDIFAVGFGAPGIESMLPLLHEEGVNQQRISLERLVSVLAEGPARIFRLPHKGRVAPGHDADLVVFDPAASTTLSDDDLHGTAYYSLYSGRTVRGLPRTVLQRGQTILDKGALVGKHGQGRFLPAGQRSPVAQPV